VVQEGKIGSKAIARPMAEAEAMPPNYLARILVCHSSFGAQLPSLTYSIPPKPPTPYSSPLFGCRQYELSQDASHAACKPGEFTIRHVLHPTPSAPRPGPQATCHNAGAHRLLCKNWPRRVHPSSADTFHGLPSLVTDQWLTIGFIALEEPPTLQARVFINQAKPTYLWN
jgi:hypothetical protein